MAALLLLVPLLLVQGWCTVAQNATTTTTPSATNVSSNSSTAMSNVTSSLQDLSLDDLDMSMLGGCTLNNSAGGCDDDLCECVDGKAVCRPRCSGALVRRGRKLQDPTCDEKPVDDCCAVIQCPDSEPEALEGCFYKNTTLQRGELFQDGCNATCSCGEGGKVNCKARCPKPPSVMEKGCVMIPDRRDKCCMVLSCNYSASAIAPGVVNITEGCDFKGKHYALHAEFHDGCDALCVCGPSGVDCLPLRCPEDGLELLDPHCVQWDLHPKDFVPTPPNCCPDEMKCLFNGSCVYEGQTFNNWAEIPQALTGCEQNCHCEFGNVTCSQVCRPLQENPPEEGCTLGKLPGEDCCQYWICPEKQQQQQQNVSGPLRIDDDTSNGHKDSVHLLLPGPVNLYDLKLPKHETVQQTTSAATPTPATTLPVVTKQQPVTKQLGKQEKVKNSGQIFITPPPPLPGDVIEDMSIPPMQPTLPPDLAEKMRNDSAVTQSPVTEMELPSIKKNPTPPPAVFHNSEEGHDEDVDSVPYLGPFARPDKMSSKGRPTQHGGGNPRRPPAHVPDPDQLDINGNLHSDQQFPWIPNGPQDQFVEHEGPPPFHPQAFPAMPPGKKTDIKDIIAHLQSQGLLPPGSHVKVVEEEGPPHQRPLPLGIPPQHILYQQQVAGRPGPPVGGGRPPVHIPEEVYLQQQQQRLPPGQLGPNVLHHPFQFLPPPEARPAGNPSSNSKKAAAVPHGLVPPPSLPQHQNYPPLPEEILFQLQQHGLLPEGPAALLRNQSGHGPNDNNHPSGFPRVQSQHPDEVVVHTLEAVDSNSVRLVFSVPPVLVGLHGRIELRFTSDKGNNDMSSWQQQILAPPNDLISTPQLEFVLGDLTPDTEYRVKVTVQLRDLHNSPSSPVLTVRTMAAALPAVIPVDPQLSVASVNSTWVEVRWGTFSDHDAQFIDGIQLRYKEVEGKVYSSTPLIHKAVNSYRLDNLRPGARYEVAIYFIPFPGQTTELQATNRIKVETLPLPDPYKFDVTVAVQQVKSTSAEVTWTGVPYPQDKYVNVFRAIYQSDQGKEDLSVYKVAKHDAQSQTTVRDLKPGTRYRLWLEIYLTNGKIKKSNVLDFTTKPGSATETQQGKLEAEGDPASVSQAGNYYSPLVAVSVLAALAILATLILLLILMKKHSQNKAAISSTTTSRKSQSAYDNPSYKVEIQQETMDL